MPKAVRNESAKGKPFCPERQTIRFDEDNRAMLNESTKLVSWDSFNYAINAAIRHAMKKFAPAGLFVRETPKEQLIFSKPYTPRRLKSRRSK